MQGNLIENGSHVSQDVFQELIGKGSQRTLTQSSAAESALIRRSEQKETTHHSLSVVEALDVLSRLRVVLGAVNVLQHVQVGRDS